MDLRDLYRDVIVDHNRAPRNFRRLDPADRSADGFNALCGDKLTVQLRLDGDTVKEVAFTGSGCAISVASASLMTERVAGLSAAEARTLAAKLHSVLTGAAVGDPESLGKLSALIGVREFPARVKCATLAWHTLAAALDGAGDTPVTTE
jgi:nitrogen fixation NifU-like protein